MRGDGKDYFELGCRRYGQSDRDRERRPLGEGDLHHQSQRDRCKGGLARFSIPGVARIVLIYAAYGFLERLLGL